jgi:hypothetical protein
VFAQETGRNATTGVGFEYTAVAKTPVGYLLNPGLSWISSARLPAVRWFAKRG